MSDEVPAEEQPGPSNISLVRSGSAQTTETPKKGILKRPSLKHEPDRKLSLIPFPGARASPDRLPVDQNSKIPKLSVTWWEKNAVAIFGDTSDENNTDSEQILKDLGSGPRPSGIRPPTIRQTAILDSEEDSEEHQVRQLKTLKLREELQEDEDDRDDAMSIASSTGSTASSIVGRWWTGKDMRFVPHCERKGCNHAHHNGHLGEYLTPTQRRNKEMSQLKKELKSALSERDEKDQHLQELRERIKEIEMLNDVQTALADSHKMMQRERETREQYEKEKKQMEKKHNIRVNQLVQETMNAREEMARLTARINELEEILGRPRVEASTMTDSVQYAIPSTSQEAYPPGETDPTDPSMFPQVPRIATTMGSPMGEGTPLSPTKSDQGGPPFGMPSPMSISMESKISGQPIYLSQEALNHIQAYQNEAFIWRTKAAQLEMVIKEQLLKSSQKEQQMMREKDSLLTELDAYRKGNPPPPIPVIREHSPVVDNLSILQIASPNLVERSTSIVPGECSDPQCIERKKNLIEENNQLLLNIEEGNVRVQELEEDVNALRNDVDAMEAEKKNLSTKLDAAQKDAEEKGAELTAGEITITRLQNEKETMQKAISYMEERMQVYQNTLMEHDLVVSDETADSWRKGCPDPRYSVMVSKRTQTEMTSQDLSKNETEFASTKRMLKDLHSEFSAKRSDFNGRFEEIEQILLVKTQLVETLTKQLEDTRRDQRLQLDEHQKEREEYKKSLVALGAIAERVPLLEQRVQELLKELSDMEIKFKEQREEYETGLEGALEEALLKYKEQSNYWKDKVNALEGQLDRTKNEMLQLTREKEELRLKSRLEHVDLEQRLTSSIEHVALLNTQVNRSRRDVECEAKPKHVSKYVACRPNVKSKGTSIEKGDLFDEAEERLKLCQGELATTRRQVHVLQQKLISTLQERADRRLQVRKKVACVVERPTSADGRRAELDGEAIQRIESLETKNVELREKLSRVEEEKASIVQQERERIQHLAQEFENVRKELDQEMCRYESEKKWLKSRIQNLEKDNQELQKQLEEKSSSLSEQTKKGLPIIAILDEEEKPGSGVMRKTLSEPELLLEDEEISRLRAENSRLMSELERVRESLRRTASAASAASRRSNRSQLSPAFGALADDLNMVKSDLEQILSQIDKDAPSKGQEGSKTPAPSRQPTPAEEEQLQSKILKNVMADWETDEREALARDLRRSREERDRLKNRIERMTADLNRANAELEVFRNERIDETPMAGDGDGRLIRSRSAANLNHEVDREEAARWKAKCGTMFRELNTVRRGYAKAIEDRRELKYQLATMRYELEMARCQMGQPRRGSVSTAYFSPKSIRSEVTSLAGYTTPAEGRNPSSDGVVVHESPVTFRKGSNREAVSCTIVASTSMRALNEPAAVAPQPRRAQSAKRSQRRRASSKEDYVAMEQRRAERQKSTSLYATAPHSVTSSMQSLGDPPAGISSKPPLPLMSQSWHEPSTSLMTAQNIESPGFLEEERSRSRAISLREKVGRLMRENAQLAAELEKKAVSQLDQERLSRLEKEKDALREQVELLLKKIQQEQSLQKRDLHLEEQLTLSRQENEMYERKIREMEEERREMYLVMFKKGQQAAKIEGQKEVDQMTQDRVVLKFLHDAFFYFLMNKGDSREHLQAIMTMLDFSPDQKEEILKRRGKSH